MSAHRSCSLTMAQFRKHFCINCPLSTEQGLSAGRRYLKLVITTAGSDFLALLITGPHTVLLKSSQGIRHKGKKKKALETKTFWGYAASLDETWQVQQQHGNNYLADKWGSCNPLFSSPIWLACPISQMPAISHIGKQPFRDAYYTR